MRKLHIPALVAVAAAAIACEADENRPVYPSWDQSILEVARAEPDLSTYAQLIDEASLAETFSSVDSVYTVFAPTNAALASVPAEVRDDPEALSRLLRYHATGGTELANLLALKSEVETLTSTTITVRGSGEQIRLSNSQPSMATIVRTNLRASNGVIHVIDGVLTPPPPPVEPLGTVIDVATEAGGFTALLAALDRVGLTATLGGAGPFTVFAPTDDAFTALGDLSAVDDGVVENVLLTHVVEGALSSSDVLAAASLSSLANTELPVDETAMTVGGATLTDTLDVMADNGVIHALEGVIVPPTIVEIAAATPSLSTLVQAVTRTSTIVGDALDPDTLSGDAPITVFAPNNAAFTASGIEVGTVGTSTLADVLRHHVVSGQMLAGDFTDGQVVATANGNVTVNVDDDGTVTITDGQGGTAEVVMPNVRTLSGVVHVIDAVLIP